MKYVRHSSLALYVGLVVLVGCKKEQFNTSDPVKDLSELATVIAQNGADFDAVTIEETAYNLSLALGSLPDSISLADYNKVVEARGKIELFVAEHPEIANPIAEVLKKYKPLATGFSRVDDSNFDQAVQNVQPVEHNWFLTEGAPDNQSIPVTATP